MNLQPRLQVIFRIFLLFCLTLVTVNAAAQAAVDPSQTGPVLAGFSSFIGKINRLADSAVNEVEFQGFVTMLFQFFAVLSIVFMFFKYSMRGVVMHEVLSLVLMLLFVQVLMSTFLVWTGVMWATAEGVAGSLQNGMIGTRDAFFAPAFIYNIVSNITFPQTSIFDPFKALVTGINVVALSLVMIVLSALSYVSVLWGFWVFILAKLVGLVFLPFVIYERLAFLFDGWLRFFIGALVYYIIARLNVVLVACAIALYFGFSIPFTIGPVQPIELPLLASPFEAIGIMVFMVVGLLALFSTGKLAGTIVQGAGGGGMGSAIGGAARAISKVAIG